MTQSLEWSIAAGAELVDLTPLGDGRAMLSALSLAEFSAGAVRVSVRAKRDGDINATRLFAEYNVTNTVGVEIMNGVVTHGGLSVSVSRYIDGAKAAVATASSASPSATVTLYSLACR